ncbi:MAG: DUF11 domain-containing protein [Sedimentisphaerales bacterium]|nr:DUF11 domain-containing protein [Sedimentisphaerales bacterium]
MKKCLNISLILLVLILTGSLGCNSNQGSFNNFLPVDSVKAPRQQNANANANTNANANNNVMQVEPIESERDVIQDAAPFNSSTLTSFPSSSDAEILKPALVSVSETGSSVISKTYPWAECGIVQLDKVMPKEIKLNEQFTYTIKITNLTDSMLSDIIVNEEYPNNFRLINTNPLAQESQNQLTWKIDSLGPKVVREITVSGLAEYPEPMKHSTTVQTPVLPAVSNVQVIQPSLKLVKSVPSEVMLCDLIPVKYIISNDGTGTITNSRISDTLPQGLRTTDGRGEISIDVGTLFENQSREYTIELRAARVGSYSSRAVANSSEMNLRAESVDTTIIVSQPVLAISKAGPDRLYIGRPLTYEIIVSNKSQVTAKDVVIEDTVPEGVTSVKATEGAQVSESNTKLTWKLDSIAPNSSQTFRISYTPTQPGVITNAATATAYCAQTVTSSVRTVVTGIPAVNLEVADLEDPVRIGNRVTYAITVTNQGSAPLTNILIACILEPNVKYISSSGSTSGTMEGDRLRFIPLGSLAPQEKAVWRITVAAATPGDVRFKVIMNSDELSRPVEQTEATYLYE